VVRQRLIKDKDNSRTVLRACVHKQGGQAHGSRLSEGVLVCNIGWHGNSMCLFAYSHKHDPHAVLNKTSTELPAASPS